MHGREGEKGGRTRGMWPVHARGKADDDEDDDGARSGEPVIREASAELSGSGFFLKDGRKIHTGDCALFQSGNAPPFIGIIRWFSLNEENNLKLSVNWLYRPSDLKLAKGVPLEAAPNEVFYSFHKDEISAQSLLHPCKVAFLRKGVELPSGISSFVCRRVYDIANKCLWWLTDQDYINEHQEEVDQLLDKTQLEMHAAVQSGGRSPKQLNGPAQQLKSGSDSIQNSGSSVPSHGKGRKREKTEQSSDSIKRDRVPKPEDGDSGNFKSDSSIKAEISKITDRGGLTDAEGVEKLLNLMQVDRSEKKIESASRVLLADVIASTDRFECLVRFVQLKGILVLDDWLQEAHKGKIGDGSSPKESDKSIEELLLALLRALDKLPVNLHALQTSNIGKSVNNLRQHKNSEIQKKARHLVDTWKKRVDAEMSKSTDMKVSAPGQTMSWSGKLGATDNAHGVNRRTGSSEVALKAPSAQTSICKTMSAKVSHIDAGRASIVSSGPSKLTSSATVSSKDVACKPGSANGPSEMQLTSIKEEKSSGSSQSQNNSQSCSSDYAKNGGTSWREDARSSTAGSIGSSSKGSGSASRHRKSSNGFLGTGSTGGHKETSFGKSASLQGRSISYDKVPPSAMPCDRLPDTPAIDTGNSQRLIVRLPNPGRSPARCTTSTSLEEASMVGSRASSPASSEKYDHSERKQKVKADSARSNHSADANANADAFNANYKRSVPTEDIGLSPGSRDELRCPGDNGDSENPPKPLSFANDKEHVCADKSNSMHDPSSVSMNPASALAENHVSEVAGSLSVGDDLGMNLLASVATGEMPKSECLSSAALPVISSSAHDCSTPDVCTMRRSCDDVSVSEPMADKKGMDGEGHVNSASGSIVEEAKLPAAQTLLGTSGDEKKAEVLKSIGNHEETSSSPEVKSSEGVSGAQEPKLASPEIAKADQEIDRNNHVLGKRKGMSGISDSAMSSRRKIQSPSSDQCKPSDSAIGKVGETNVSTSDAVCSSFGETSDGMVVTAKLAEKKTDEGSERYAAPNMRSDEVGKMSEESNGTCLIGSQATPAPGTCESSSKATAIIAPSNLVPKFNGDDLDPKKEGISHLSTGLAVCDVASKETDHQDSDRSKVDDNGKLSSPAETIALPIPTGSNGAAKCVFDLNEEGISSDEGNLGEASVGAPVGSLPTVRLPNFLPFTIAPMSSGSSVPITVAAAAKRPFVPPENPLKGKGEPGWKGSAATSAFRPAEPRKVLEMPLSSLDSLADTVSLKQNRTPLEIDLNVPDERAFHDVASNSSAADAMSGSTIVESHDAQGRNGGLDLDLNRAGEDAECGSSSMTISRRSEVSNLLGKPALVVFPNSDASSFRGIDLNNGPLLDEAGTEPAFRSQHSKSNASFFSHVPNFRMSGTELGNLSWYPPGNSYTTVAIPPFLPDRSDHPYPILAAPGAPRSIPSATVAGSFSNDLYRGPVLSSSPAMAFSPYANFPFGPSFPLHSTTFSGVPAAYVDSSQGGGCFPPIPSQLAGPATAASPAYMRPILISIPDRTASPSGSDTRKWGRQSLDLNAGPLGAEVEGREERLSVAARQHFVASSQPFADDPARLFQIAGSAGLKRKEPDGGWESDRYTYKQPSRP